jgi:hypothetical protein
VRVFREHSPSHHSSQVACKGAGWGNGSECISTFDAVNRHTNLTYGIFLLGGVPCQKYAILGCSFSSLVSSFQGYCNGNGKCVTVNTQACVDEFRCISDP